MIGALRDHFRPEFLNRVDEIVVFGRLDREQPRRSSSCRWRGCATVCASAEELEPARPQPGPGARGLRPGVRGPPAQAAGAASDREPARPALLAGEVRDGDVVVVDAEGDELTFAVAEPAVATSKD